MFRNVHETTEANVRATAKGLPLQIIMGQWGTPIWLP